MDSIKLYIPKALPWLAVAAILAALYVGKLSYEVGQAIAAFSGKKAEP